MNARSGAKFRLTAMAAAMLAVGAAWADERDDEIARLKRPDREVSVGAGYVSDDNTRFGQYNGMTNEGLYLLFDARIRQRDDATGTWTNITARNLGLESRELRLDQSKQGDWGYFIDFSQTPRYSPYTALTRLTGYDSTTQTVNGAATASPLELKTERKTLNAGVDKWVSSRWDVRLGTRYEEKTGRRLFGRTGTDFLVDPIDYRTQLYEANVGYTGEKGQFTVGYYGTNFVNNKNHIDVLGGTGAGFSPIALPPGSQSHQAHLAGGYNFTPTTRGTYKLAYTHQTQDDSFIDVSSTGRTNLGGVIDTKFGQLGLTARPTSGLSVVADLRKENRDDKTPVVDYFPITVTSTATGVNEPRTIHSTVGKLEASYLLPAAFRLIGGYDYDQRRRNTSDIRVVSYRETTTENTLRMELRRSLSETVNGSIGYAHSKRGGSEWQTTMQTGALGSNLVQPLHLADRERDKVRATAGWTPTEKVDLQARAEYSKDKYGGRALGLQDGTGQFYSLDGAYRIAESWQVLGWVSREDTRASLLDCASAFASNSGVIATSCPNTAANPIWTAHLRSVGNAIGIGLKGKPTGQLELVADFHLSSDRGEFRNGPTPAGVTSVPDTKYNRSVTKLTANYAMQKNTGLKLQYIHDRFSTNDWTWDTWTYADGTRILPNSQQKVDFIAASVYYNF